MIHLASGIPLMISAAHAMDHQRPESWDRAISMLLLSCVVELLSIGGWGGMGCLLVAPIVLFYGFGPPVHRIADMMTPVVEKNVHSP